MTKAKKEDERVRVPKDPNKRVIQGVVSAEILKKLKAAAIDGGCRTQDIVNRAIEAYLENTPGPIPAPAPINYAILLRMKAPPVIDIQRIYLFEDAKEVFMALREGDEIREWLNEFIPDWDLPAPPNDGTFVNLTTVTDAQVFLIKSQFS